MDVLRECSEPSEANGRGIVTSAQVFRVMPITSKKKKILLLNEIFEVLKGKWVIDHRPAGDNNEDSSFGSDFFLLQHFKRDCAKRLQKLYYGS